MEYPVEFIESLVCLNCRGTEDLIFWKEVFVQMKRSTFNFFSVFQNNQISFYSETLENVTDLRFSGKKSYFRFTTLSFI